jgi:uncharacterized protein
MRVILDANVFISYLLSRSEKQTIARIVRTCFVEFEHVQLIVPPELVDELRENVQEEEYLHEHITRGELEGLISQLHCLAEVPTPLSEDIPSFVRGDPEDDYLIVHGLSTQADYLVTGDKLLLALKKVETLQIISPSAFLAILSEAGRM